MKTTVTKWATKAVGAGTVALLLATPAFAQSRGDWNRNDNSNRGAQATQQTRDANHSRNQFNNDSRSRENQRFSSYGHEREGYREGYRGEERGRTRVGLSINIGGILPVYRTGFVRGVVDDVDYRTGTVWIRDDMSGSEISAAVGSDYALRGLYRGEFVELSGRWLGNGVFDVARIASIR